VIGTERTGILSTNDMRAFRVAFSKAETGFKVTLPLIPDFYQKSLRTKIRFKILELNSRKNILTPTQF